MVCFVWCHLWPFFFLRPSESNVPEFTEAPSEAPIIPEKEMEDLALPKKGREGLLLEIFSAGTAQVKVSADGGLPKTYSMARNERISIRAVDGFNLLLEDKCAVALFYNGRPVEIPGRCGRPVTLMIPQGL